MRIKMVLCFLRMLTTTLDNFLPTLYSASAEIGFFRKRNILNMINMRYQHIVFAFFMAFLMSCLMSFVVTIFNVGFVNNIFNIWLKAWVFSFVIAFPSVIVVSPVVRKLVTLTVKQK